MSDEAGERTEAASEKRRGEFRERGELPRSRDLLSLLVLLAGLSYFNMMGGDLFQHLGEMLRHWLSLPMGRDWTVELCQAQANSAIVEMALMLMPLVGAVFLAGILGNVAQVGFLLTTKPLEPDFNKLNFFARFIPAFFNKQSLINLVGSLAKIAVVSLVIYLTLAGDYPEIAVLSKLSLMPAIGFILDHCLSVLLNVCLVMIVIAGVDYAWNRFDMEERMKMTKEEVKQEQKEDTGDPHILQARRRRAMDLAKGKLAVAVPQATVIVNNPTHLSVALRYRPDVDAAPVVIAKGADLMAHRIRQLAREHNIPMVEDKPLARALYRGVPVGHSVPVEFYRAVAEVLAFVMKRRGRSAPARAAGVQ